MAGQEMRPGQGPRPRANSSRKREPNWERRRPSRPADKKKTATRQSPLPVKTNLGGSAAAAPSQETPRFVDKWQEVHQHQNRLPHWQQDGCTYFVTFHLADSIPRSKFEEWTTERAGWLKWNSPPWSEKQQQEYIRRFVNTVERWLDAGEGSCLLRDQRFAGVIGEALNYFDGVRYQQHAWVVMPNHVHLLFSIFVGQQLDHLLRNWKGLTSRTINRALNHSGSLWQKDYSTG